MQYKTLNTYERPSIKERIYARSSQFGLDAIPMAMLLGVETISALNGYPMIIPTPLCEQKIYDMPRYLKQVIKGLLK